MLWPAVVGIVLVVALVLLLRGLGVLGSWSEIYGPSGRFVVEECAATPGRLSARAECDGTLLLGDVDPVPSTLVGPEASFGADLPQAGAEVEVYHRAGDVSRSFPVAGRPTELARVIVGLIPLFFVVGGLGCWLVGWMLTRGFDPDGTARSRREPWSARFALRPRGITWATVGFAWLLVDRLVVGELLGTAGLG